MTIRTGLVPQMDEDAQRLYLNAMIANPGIFARVNHLLSPTYFDPHLAKGVKFLKEYFQENRAVPASSIFTTSTKLATDHVPLNIEDSNWVLGQIAEFCRFKAVIEQVQKAVSTGGYIEKGDLGTMMMRMKEATEMGLLTDLGINYFENVEARLESYETEDAVISTGWGSVDALIGGGVGRQELVLFLAPTGGGKSVGMLNLAHNFMAQGLSGVYISFEMKDKKVALRTDQMLARMTSGMISMNKTEVAHEIRKFHEKTNVQFHIKRMRETTSTSADISAYLRELQVKYAFRPDFVVGDYIDIMGAIQKGGEDNMFTKDKYVTEEFRALGLDHNAIMISGSQLGKHATEAIQEGKVIHQGDVQGGSSKSNTADLMITMEKTEAMHEAGEYRFGFAKARNSDATGKRVSMKWSKRSLLISDWNGGDGAGSLELNKNRPGPKGPRRPGIIMPPAGGGRRKTIEELLGKDSTPEVEPG